MVVHVDRMRENLERSHGIVFSGTVLLELARRGVARETAYEWVQRNAMRSFDEHRDFKTLLLADPDIMGVLSRADLDRAFDLDGQFKFIDSIFDRVFVPASALP
jgi:adenylosuccinate lyase